MTTHTLGDVVADSYAKVIEDLRESHALEMRTNPTITDTEYRRIADRLEAIAAAQSRAGVVTDERPTLRVIAKRNLESLIKAVVNDDHHKKTMLSCLEELS